MNAVPDPVGPLPVQGHDCPGTHIWGWMCVPELEWLYKQAQRMASIVEIGSLRGRSAFALLKACRGPVYCIDPWDDDKGYCLPAFMDACGGFPNLHPIQGLSPEAADQVPKVDMVFVDGSHDYDSVIRDLDAWTPKAARLICGHDYQNEHYPGVKQAVDERFGAKVKAPKDTSIWAVTL